MSSQHRPTFDSSLPAVVRLKARARPECPARRLGPASRLSGASVTAMCIPFAPEPAPATPVLELREDQATGPLPLGFDFEFFGTQYNWFELSSDGFMTFGTSLLAWPHSGPRSHFIPVTGDLDKFISLGWPDAAALGRRQIAYEVRGAAQRRRLVLSFTWTSASPEGGPAPMAVQLTLHERTGMIEVHTTRPDPVGCGVTEAVRFTTTRRSVHERSA